MNNFFKDNNERDLWIKLNAQRILYHNNKNNKFKTTDIGDITTKYSPMWISKNQLEYDENNSDDLRFSFEELIMLSEEELYSLNEKRNTFYNFLT